MSKAWSGILNVAIAHRDWRVISNFALDVNKTNVYIWVAKLLIKHEDWLKKIDVITIILDFFHRIMDQVLILIIKRVGLHINMVKIQ